MKARILSVLLAASALGAQGVPAEPTGAFFAQDPKAVSLLCASEAERLKPAPQVMALQGAVLLAAGDRVKAEQAFTRAMVREPGNPRVLRIIAQAWMRHGTRDEALAAYKSLAAVNTGGRFDNKKNVLLWAAVDLMQGGFAKEAAEYMEQSYALDHDDPNNFIEFGRAALMAGQRDLAATYFARATKAEPKDVDVWLDISGAYRDCLARERKAAAPK